MTLCYSNVFIDELLRRVAITATTAIFTYWNTPDLLSSKRLARRYSGSLAHCIAVVFYSKRSGTYLSTHKCTKFDDLVVFT